MRRIYRNLLCPAKVNLILRIGPLREDGFHDLESWMMKVDWGDLLSLSLQTASRPSISLQSTLKMAQGENLVERAFMAFCREFDVGLRAVVHLMKRVPTGAGLGGGSSDAATILKVLADFCWKGTRAPRGAKQRRLMTIAAQLGSDIPFFLGPSSSWCEGRGERLTPLTTLPHLHLVLLFPRAAIATPWAYAELDRFRAKDLRPLSRSPSNQGKPRRFAFPLGCPDWLTQRGERDRDSASFVPDLVNDFEAPVFSKYPKLEKSLQRLRDSGAIAARMSGSGSTLFGLYPSAEAAQKAQKWLKAQGLRALATQTLRDDISLGHPNWQWWRKTHLPSSSYDS